MECVCISLEDASGDGLFGECCSAPETRCSAVDGGASFTLAVNDNGEMVGWGSAFYGELGAAEAQEQCEGVEQRVRIPPTRIILQKTCTAVACGSNHVLALTSDGRVMAWGSNSRGQLARSLDISASAFPAQVNLLLNRTAMEIVAVAAGGSHSMALSRDGSVWTWGDNQHGQLGRSTSETPCSRPDSIRLSSSVARTAAGHAHSAVVDVGGRLFTFGWGLYHQLGHGSTEIAPYPRMVEAFEGVPGGVTEIACGMWHTAAISSQGDVYTWGWGPDGQLGPDQGTSRPLPSVVDTADGYFNGDDRDHDAGLVACGVRFTLVQCRSGEVFCWGKNFSSGESMKYCTKSIAAGNSHAILLIQARGDIENGDLKQ